MKVILLLAIIVGCTHAVHRPTSTNPSSSHFFNRKLLKHIKSYIDVEASPCDDFYQYACGRWLEHNPLANKERQIEPDTAGEDTNSDETGNSSEKAVEAESSDKVQKPTETDMMSTTEEFPYTTTESNSPAEANNTSEEESADSDEETSDNDDNSSYKSNKFHVNKSILSPEDNSQKEEVMDKRPYYSAETKVNYEINAELVQYMNGMSRRNKPESVKKAHTFYMSCKDLETYKVQNYVDWLLNEHENMTWALFTPSTETDVEFDWVRTWAMMRRYGMNDIFIEENKYERDDAIPPLYIGLIKPIDYKPLTEAQFDSVFDSLDFPDDTKPKDELWKEISEFEKQLVALDKIRDDDEYKYITVIDLPLAWLYKYMGIALDQAVLDLNMEIGIERTRYLKALDKLLEYYDDAFICRYLEFRFVWFLFRSFPEHSAESCMGLTRGALSLPMNWLYEQQHPELYDEIPRIYEIFDNILETIKEVMRSDKSGVITEDIMTTLDKIKLKVGNLPRMNTTEIIDRFHDRLELDKSEFYGNHLKLLEFRFNASHSDYWNYLNSNISQMFFLDDIDDASSFLPYYISTPNVVIAPLTLMRQPFYHWGYDDVFKYSSLGKHFAYVILNGILDNEEYDHLESHDKLDEIGGLYASYRALVSLLPDELKEEKFLRGAQATFFLNFAQGFCNADEPVELNGYLTHFAEFSEVFDCKLRNFLETFVSTPQKD